MLASDTAEDLQSQTLRAYIVLSQIRTSWAGALVLNLGLDRRGAAVSLATNIAGGVCLSLEDDPALLRAALRAGSCDFIVNTLDEAIRAMKNEVRKRVPLCVGLEGDLKLVLLEIIERGLAPELFTGGEAFPAAAEHFRSLRAAIVSFDDASPASNADGPHQLHTFSFPTSAELRAFDARAISLLPPDDRLRRHWLLSAPKMLPRDRHRVLWLTPAEAAALQTAP